MYSERTGKECASIPVADLAARATALVMSFDMSPKQQCYRLLRLAGEIGLDAEELIWALELDGMPAHRALEELFYFLEEELELIAAKAGEWN